MFMEDVPLSIEIIINVHSKDLFMGVMMYMFH